VSAVNDQTRPPAAQAGRRDEPVARRDARTTARRARIRHMEAVMAAFVRMGGQSEGDRSRRPSGGT
jgi:hypothetical protein